MLEVMLHQAQKLTSDWVNLIQGTVRVLETPFTLKDYTLWPIDGRLFAYNSQTQHFFYQPTDATYTPIVNANHPNCTRVPLDKNMYFVTTFWTQSGSVVTWWLRVGIVTDYTVVPTYTMLKENSVGSATSLSIRTAVGYKNFIYFITVASNGDKFYSYNLTTKVITQKIAPASTIRASPMVNAGNFLYAKHYVNTTTVQISKYNIGTDTWSLIPAPPGITATFGNLVGSANYLYYIESIGTTDALIWAMDVLTNEWSLVTPGIGYPLRIITQLNGRLYSITTNVEATSMFIEIS